jgi:hypothetical protein
VALVIITFLYWKAVRREYCILIILTGFYFDFDSLRNKLLMLGIYSSFEEAMGYAPNSSFFNRGHDA